MTHAHKENVPGPAEMGNPGYKADLAELLGRAEELMHRIALQDSDHESHIPEHEIDIEVTGRAQKTRRCSAPEAALEAGKQLKALTGLKFDNISNVEKKGDGWHVVATMVELKRVPSSTDVLAAYEVELDAEGNLDSYRRINRYLRSQTGADF